MWNILHIYFILGTLVASESTGPAPGYSYMASITRDQKPVCNGILETRRTVLTMVECVQDRNLWRHRVNILTDNGRIVQRRIRAIKTIEGNQEMIRIVLATIIRARDDRVGPVKNVYSSTEPPNYDDCRIIKFSSEKRETLQHIPVRYVPEECEENRICFTSKTTEYLCNFDSGAPIFCRNPTKWILAGFISMDSECTRINLKGIKSKDVYSVCDVENAVGYYGQLQVRVPGEATFGDRADVICDEGYSSKTKTLICKDGSWFPESVTCTSDVLWNGLTARWGRDPSNSFFKLPRTRSDAVSLGWVPLVPGSGCSDHAMFIGERYIKDDDITMIVIFGPNGYIAGIQTGFAEDFSPNPNNFPVINAVNDSLILDNGTYFITAYFTNPKKICAGRAPEQFEQDGTGKGLWIQNGTSPTTDKFRIPNKQSAVETTKWVKGPCFPTMGLHFWYDLSVDGPCDQLLPVFLLYNRGELIGFGWSFGAEITGSKYYEYPPAESFKFFMDPIPICLYDVGQTSTIHFFFEDDVRVLTC